MQKLQEIKTFSQSHAGRAFVKMHGLRNHFVITDARSDAYRPDDEEIIRICDPQTGIGADQLIIIEPPTAAGKKGGAGVFMRILNVDAREVEACGNATRCVAWLLLRESGDEQMVIETQAGLLECKIAGDNLVTVDMGRITMDWQQIPLAEERDTCHLDLSSGSLHDAVALNIGNPHVVYFVSDLDAVDIEALAPPIQQHPLFPEQVNVGVAELEDESNLRLKVYERGAGLTTACGSGACVAAFAALARGLTEQRRMTVSMPAGQVVIEISDDGIATMTGPVAYCFSGILQPT
jgi:diaminopimelate epimerase